MTRRLLLAAPYLVSLAYVAFIFSWQPADRLGAPAAWPFLDQGVYDDQDVAAMAQRGLNAHLGRKAGRVDEPDNREDADLADALDHPQPLRERYFLEYPHAAVWLFRLPFDVSPPTSPPPAILDGGIGDAHFHLPRNDTERTFWTHLRWAVRCYEVAMLVVLWALIATLQWGMTRDGTLASTGLLLCLPAALYFSINRFDALPALFLALSLATLGRGWLILSGGLLAVGAALKIAPGLLAPLILCYLVQTQGLRPALRWLGGALAVGLAILAVQLGTEDLTALLGPYRFQAERKLYGWTIYGFLLPPALAEQNLAGKLLRHGGLLLLIVALCWKAIPSLEVLLRRGAVLLIGFVLLQVIFSPQWILWFYPLILPLVRGQRTLGILLAILDVSTYTLWPLASTLEWPPEVGIGLQDVRLVAQFGLCWCLLRGGITRTTTS
jgi:hypothetical protein